MPLVGSDRWRHFLLVDYAGENLFWADKDLRRLWFALLFCLSIPFHLCAWFISWNVQNNKRAYSPPCLWVVIVDPAVFSSKALEAGATIAREVLEMTSAQLKEKTERCPTICLTTCPTRGVRKCQENQGPKDACLCRYKKTKRTERFKYDQICICLCDFRKYCDILQTYHVCACVCKVVRSLHRTLKCEHGV